MTEEVEVQEMDEAQDPQFFEDLLLKFMYLKEHVRDRIYPHLDLSLFDRHENRHIVTSIQKHVDEYGAFPTFKDTRLSMMKLEDDSAFKHVKKIYDLDVRDYDNKFLMNELEEFFKQKMVQNICYDVMEKTAEAELDAIGESPDLLREALAFSFDVNIGLNVFSPEAEERMFKQFHEKKHTIPTGIELFDDMIEGGFQNKSLSLFLAETNMGKSLIMNSLAVSNVFQNKKVLYISCELSEERTAERSLANIFDMETQDLKMLSKNKFHERYDHFIKQFADNFMVVEYPTKSANCNDLRNLLKELELKLNYKPDIVYLDQIENLNPVHKSRSDQTHNEMKRVTMEVRGLAVESNVPWVSAIQTNRDGMSSSEIDLKNTGDSIGYVQIADLVIGVTQTEELKAAGKMVWAILKNRFGPNNKKLTVCVDYSKMRITNDDEAFVEFRNDGDKTAPTDSQKKENKLSIINDVANMIDNNNNIEDDKFMNLSDDYD